MEDDDQHQGEPPATAEAPPPFDVDPDAEIVVHADGRVTTEAAPPAAGASRALELGEARANADGELMGGVVTMASPHAPVVMAPSSPAVGPLAGGSQVREVGRAVPALSLIIGGASSPAPSSETDAVRYWQERLGKIRELLARRSPDLVFRARDEARVLRAEIEAGHGPDHLVDLCRRAELGRL